MIASRLLCLWRRNDAIRMLMPRYITRSCVPCNSSSSHNSRARANEFTGYPSRARAYTRKIINSGNGIMSRDCKAGIYPNGKQPTRSRHGKAIGNRRFIGRGALVCISPTYFHRLSSHNISDPPHVFNRVRIVISTRVRAIWKQEMYFRQCEIRL